MAWYKDASGRPYWKEDGAGNGVALPAGPMMPIQVQKGQQDLRIGESAEARAIRDQQMQEKRFQWEQAERLKDRDTQTAATTRETEDKAGAFYIRAKGSDAQYQATGEGPRGYIGEAFRNVAPNLQNSLPTWLGGNDEGRQVADSAQDEFIAASLRQDSGAAIPDQEIERQRRIYFPMPGDSPATIKAKDAARARALKGLEVSAGRRLPAARRGFYSAPAVEMPETDPQEAAAGLDSGRARLQQNIEERTRGMNPAQKAAYAKRVWEFYNKDPRVRGLKAKKAPPRLNDDDALIRKYLR